MEKIKDQEVLLKILKEKVLVFICQNLENVEAR